MSRETTTEGAEVKSARAPQNGQASRKGARSRRELTRTAIDCFSHYGYRGTSVDRIAKMAGVTKGAIYYHFKDKEDLLAAAVTDRVGAFEDRIQSSVRGTKAPDALRRIAEVNLEHALSNDHPRFAITLMIECIDTNAAVSEALRDMMRRFRGFVRNLIRDGQEKGEVRADVDPKAVAAAYVSSILGAEIQYYQDPDRFAFRASVETFLEQLLAGLEPSTNGGG